MSIADDLFAEDPLELLDDLAGEYIEDLPHDIASFSDLDEAGRMLLRLAGAYSYLDYLLARARILSRQMKSERGAKDKEALLMQDRRDAIEKVTEIVEKQYAAVSRCVTIKQENNKELMMMKGM